MLKKKFIPAINGIVDGMKHRAILVQFILGFMAILAGIVLNLSYIEWVIVIICIGFVIASEMLNTCIEMLCDLVTKEKNESIRLIKDIAAGAVLVASITAFITALLILIRHL